MNITRRDREALDELLGFFDDCKDLTEYHVNAMLVILAEHRERAVSAANEKLRAVEGESKGWHGVVVECEKILNAVGTAEKPLTSNLPNLIRDRLQNLHRAEEANAKLAAECEGLRELLRQVRNDLHRSRAFIGKWFPHVKDEINTTMDKIDAALSAAAGRG